MSAASPQIAGAGAIFIDDIVLPDGHTYMGVLGGGVVHAMMGAAVWDSYPGLIALAGYDLPETIRLRLEQSLDLQGLHYLDIPQIRAWQIFEHDGTRRELYRVADTIPFIRGAQPEHLPVAYEQTQGFYLLQNFEDMTRWRAHLPDKYILWEPAQQIMSASNKARFQGTLKNCKVDIVSPNLAEAQAIYGEQNTEALLDNMLHDGAQIVVIRMGENGSLIGNQQGERYKIPATIINQVVDQTGAGNTYCGAFLSAIVQEDTLLEAGLKAAVAASYCLEHIGVIDPLHINPALRNVRYQTTLAHIQT